MDIEQLQTEDRRHSVPAVHPRLAVIKATTEQRGALAEAARLAGAIVVGRPDADAVLEADSLRRQAAHTRAVDTQQARLGAATTNHDEAVSREAAAGARLAMTRRAVADFDDLLADAEEADARSQTASADRRRDLLRFIDAIDQLEAVEVQRGEAAATLKKAQAKFGATHTAGTDARPEPELQAHISALHTALDTAETARQADVALAEEQLASVLAEVRMAAAGVTEAWGRLAVALGDPSGRPDPDTLAGHRENLLSAAAATERDASLATVAVLSANRHQAEETRRLDELDGIQAHSARTLDVLRAWLEGVAATRARSGPEPAPVVVDDALADIDPSARAALLQTLVSLSGQMQLLYLTDQVDVLAWAISLPHDIGGIDLVVTVPDPVLALTE